MANYSIRRQTAAGTKQRIKTEIVSLSSSATTTAWQLHGVVSIHFIIDKRTLYIVAGGTLARTLDLVLAQN